MNVANIDLCRELYELSGWWEEDQEYFWFNGRRYGVTDELKHRKELGGITKAGKKILYPAYDLGFLLRKLPPFLGVSTSKFVNAQPLQIWANESDDWRAEYGDIDGISYQQYADTPEDAACKLAIELFKQRVLK